MAADGVTRLEVWGDPIDHSISPRVHAAAYAELGWDWSYGRRRVTAAEFAGEFRELGPEYRGLSLTYPLKTEAFSAAGTRDRAATLTGAVNTLLLTGDEPRGFNTDVGGIVTDLREHGVDGIESARIVGAGATATSALVALGTLGASRIEVVARRPEAVAHLIAVGEQAGIAVTATGLDAAATASVPVTVSTLPGGTDLASDVAARLATGGGLLYDVVYGHWPTPLARAWEDACGTAVNGLGMLLHQAVAQVRVFGFGDAEAPLPREDAVIDVMRRALMGD